MCVACQPSLSSLLCVSCGNCGKVWGVPEVPAKGLGHERVVKSYLSETVAVPVWSRFGS